MKRDFLLEAVEDTSRFSSLLREVEERLSPHDREAARFLAIEIVADLVSLGLVYPSDLISGVGGFKQWTTEPSDQVKEIAARSLADASTLPAGEVAWFQGTSSGYEWCQDYFRVLRNLSSSS